MSRGHRGERAVSERRRASARWWGASYDAYEHAAAQPAAQWQRGRVHCGRPRQSPHQPHNHIGDRIFRNPADKIYDTVLYTGTGGRKPELSIRLTCLNISGAVGYIIRSTERVVARTERYRLSSQTRIVEELRLKFWTDLNDEEIKDSYEKWQAWFIYLFSL